MHPVNIIVWILFVALMVVSGWQVVDWLRRDPMRTADDEDEEPPIGLAAMMLQTVPAVFLRVQERKSPRRQKGRFHYIRPVYRGGKKK